MNTQESIIIEKEKSALNKWCKGDTSEFIEIASEEITYFDPYLEKRINGKDEFDEYMKSISGTFSIFRYELINPVVQIHNNVCVLTFLFISYSEEGNITSRWNGTEVYKIFNNDWKIIHSHWSKTKLKNK